MLPERGILKPMQKTCANGWCHQSFDVTDEDLAFYDKVSPEFGGKKYLIPPPTLCPECRKQRRLTWLNMMNLYRRRCDNTDISILSNVSPDKPYPVFSTTTWWSDSWNKTDSGREYDDNRSFFEQYQELMLRAPIPNLFSQPSADVNSEYTNFAMYDKNCYLIFHANYSEDCMYGFGVKYCKNAVDTHSVFSSELLYECIDCENSYNLIFSQDCENCSDGTFLHECIGCKECIACHGLRNAEHCIFNKKVTKEEYEQAIRSVRGGSSRELQDWKKRVDDFMLEQPRVATIMHQCEDCSGDHLFRCQNVQQSFDTKETRDGKFLERIFNGPNSDIYDAYQFGMQSELAYETLVTGITAREIRCSAICRNQISNFCYCYYCESSSDCFGCVGLEHKKFCILNKQYTQKEYEALVPKIIEKMQLDKEWGEFFPASISPFGYNETVAQEYFPLTKDAVIERGWKWSDYESPQPTSTKTISGTDLPDSTLEIPDDILNWAIVCETTAKPFKIIKQELDFYRNMKLPIPRLHPDERHKRRMALRNPRKLWNRSCAKCSKQISTSYAPERPEIVYCERCYLETVY